MKLVLVVRFEKYDEKAALFAAAVAKNCMSNLQKQKGL